MRRYHCWAPNPNAQIAGHTHVAISSLILTAVALQAYLLKKDNLALQTRSPARPVSGFAELEEALSLAQPGGYVRVFIDEGRSIQSLLAQWLAHAGVSPLRGYATHLLSALIPN